MGRKLAITTTRERVSELEAENAQLRKLLHEAIGVIEARYYADDQRATVLGVVSEHDARHARRLAIELQKIETLNASQKTNIVEMKGAD